MGRIFNNTNTGAPSGGGRINRLKAGQQNQSQSVQTQSVQPTQTATKKTGLLQRSADLSQKLIYNPIQSAISNVYKAGETAVKFPAALIGQRITTNPLKGINPISAVRDAARYSTEQFRGGDTIAQQAIAGAGTEMEVARQSLEKAKSDYKKNPTSANKKKLASATVRNITAQAGGYATGATAEIAGNLGNPATAATGYAYNAIQPAKTAIKNISLGESALSISKDMPKKVGAASKTKAFRSTGAMRGVTDEQSAFGPGKYITKDPDVAEMYADVAGGGVVSEVVDIDPKKVLNLSRQEDLTAFTNQAIKKYKPSAGKTGEAIQRLAKELGYEAIEGDEITGTLVLGRATPPQSPLLTEARNLDKAKQAILESPTLTAQERATVQSAKSFDEVWNIVKTKGPDTQGMFMTRLQTSFENAPKTTTPTNPLLSEARKYKSAELDKIKADTFWGKSLKPTVSEVNVPIDSFGEGKPIGIKQAGTTEKGVQEWMTRIKNGERPAVLVGDGRPAMNQPANVVLDGNHRLEAYRRLGIKEIPIIDNTSSQLTSIWEEAQKGQQVINSGGKTTAKQNQQLQSVIENLRKGKDAQPIQERGFITTVRQSKNTPQGVKDIIKGSYVPKSNASLTEDARALVGADPFAAEALALNPRNAVDIEVGNQLMAHYSAVGNHQKVAQIGEAMATSGTELGQAIQAFSKYDNTTPQGAIRFAQAAIQKHNALGKNIVKMSDDQIKHIYDAAASVQELPMGRERNIATQQLIDEVNNLIPSTVGDKAITVWKAGLLTSLRTHERNILGNTIMSVSERAKDIPAVGADILMSKKTGVRTVTATNQGTISGAKKGWQAAIDVVRTGYDPEQAINKYDVRHVTWGNNPVEQGLKKYTDVVYRTLGAEDKIFWNSAYARSLYDQAGAEAINVGQRGNKAFIEKLVQSPNEQMLLNATLDANVSTFKDKNILSGVINQAKQAMSKNEWSKVGGEILAPFTGVPSSVLGKFVDYSPIGFANGVRHAGKVMSGKVPALQRQAAQEIGRGVIGSALYGLGAYLASKGLLTGQAKDAKEARQWELEGKKANSVLIGGKWRSLQSVGPQTLILLAGAKAQETLGNKEGLVTYGSQIGKDFLGQSFLAGVQGPLNAITDPQRYGMSYAKSQVSSVVPNIVKDTAKAFDPLQRETNSITDALKGSIPGTRNTLTPKRDVLGNIMSNDTSGLRAYIDLLGSSKKKSSPIIDELSRLNDVGFNATPSKILPTLSSGSGKRKVKIKLTPAELNTLEGNISSELQTKLNREVQSAHYKNMTDEDKAKKIQDVVEKVRSEYKKKAIRSYNR